VNCTYIKMHGATIKKIPSEEQNISLVRTASNMQYAKTTKVRVI